LANNAIYKTSIQQLLELHKSNLTTAVRRSNPYFRPHTNSPGYENSRYEKSRHLSGYYSTESRRT